MKDTRKPGPKPGSHWKSTANWSNGDRHYPNIEDHVGPFVTRTDFPNNVRPAVWANCPYCSQLFLRSMTELKSRARRYGKESGNTFCSLSCAASFRKQLRFKICQYCSKPFKLNNAWEKRKVTCSNRCRRLVQSEQKLMMQRLPLTIYAVEHNIEADYSLLTCDYCGATQRTVGKPTHVASQHRNVRISEVNGKFVARCKNCYKREYAKELNTIGRMTAAERLRRKQATQLIREFNRANRS